MELHIHTEDEDVLQDIVDKTCVMKDFERNLPHVEIKCTFVEHDACSFTAVYNVADTIVVRKKSEIDDVTYTFRVGAK